MRALTWAVNLKYISDYVKLNSMSFVFSEIQWVWVASRKKGSRTWNKIVHAIIYLICIRGSNLVFLTLHQHARLQDIIDLKLNSRNLPWLYGSYHTLVLAYFSSNPPATMSTIFEYLRSVLWEMINYIHLFYGFKTCLFACVVHVFNHLKSIFEWLKSDIGFFLSS